MDIFKHADMYSIKVRQILMYHFEGKSYTHNTCYIFKKTMKAMINMSHFLKKNVLHMYSIKRMEAKMYKFD